jgi:hypothetical protein
MGGRVWGGTLEERGLGRSRLRGLRSAMLQSVNVWRAIEVVIRSALGHPQDSDLHRQQPPTHTLS